MAKRTKKTGKGAAAKPASEAPEDQDERESTAPGPVDLEAEREKRRGYLRAAMIAVGVILIGVAAASLDFEPNLSHIDIGVVSGPEEGNYFAMVEAFRARAEEDGGSVRNLPSQGSRENLRRLRSPGEDCSVDFGLAQDGAFEDEVEVEMVGRLTTRETLFFLGQDADLIVDFRDLDGLRIGVGPEESGTAHLVERMLTLPGFERIDVELVYGRIVDQIEAAATGELDLAASVVFEDAAVIVDAVRERGLTIASFASTDAVASRLGAARSGRLAAGHYDPIAGIPATDRRVLQVETLVLASHCASRSEVNAILAVLARELPGFIELNRREVPPHGLALNHVASEFYENHGPPLVDQYLPRVVDIVPLSNFMTFVMGLSILFNVMSLLNRFRLWRLDAGRAKADAKIVTLFGEGITRAEIELLDPNNELRSKEQREKFDKLIRQLTKLLKRCRRQAGSMLVPMGQEMVYRYQEGLIMDLLATLKQFRKKLPPLSGD